MSKIELLNINKEFGAVQVIHDFTLTVEEGEFVVLVGPSGCGKSTLLRIVAGLEDFTSGELRIDGHSAHEWTPVKRGVSMVFQSYALYPNMTVAKNMAFGLEQAGLPRKEIRERVAAVAATLKLEPLMNRRPSQLSGGQSQRVAIGRAIVRDPGVFLFDEPLSNLDAELRVHMRVELAALHQRLQKTMIYVTHDQVEAMTLADRIVVINAGRIEQIGTPLEIYNSPRNKFVAGFVGSPRMNFFPGRLGNDAVVKIPGGQIRMPGDIGGDMPQALVVGIRPEHLEVCSTENADIVGQVVLSEQLGGESNIYVLIKGESEPVIVRQPGQTTAMAGDSVGVRASADLAHLFHGDTGECLNAAAQTRRSS